MTTILLIIAAAIVAVLLYAATKPGSFSISRSADIDAPPARIFPLINDLADHEKWSPFARDPKVTNTLGSPSAGSGAYVDFVGSQTGKLSITDSRPDSKIAMRLQMTKPMACDHAIDFALVPRGNATNVTWTISGKQPYLGKLMSVFIDCDKMCGNQFERGLADLKSLVEGQPALRAAE
jgi:hypothetical protein